MATTRTTGGTILASGIRTRERKDRKPYYSDEWALGDDEIEGHHTFSIDEKIKSSKFDINFVKDLTGVDFNLAYVQKNGFNWPLLFKDKKQLDIVIPDEGFSINDVRLSVGSRRMLDVMDVNTQKNVEMTMKDWQRYYESQDKDKLLNVISLEFSHTRLESLVEPPRVVRQIDWVEKVWPRHLKDAQTESTNVLEDMMYPKVQKYCLMSVKGCYTDFHIDFGGTSVWYHILKGKKIFWLIPPSERNLQLYEQWVLSGKQSDIFFGDTVDKCARIELNSGNTFFIPTGWIHAVYTPDDSLVFGGNFLHSFGIEKQLRVATVEDTTHVPQKFRYPFFTEMLWYLLERYVHVLLQKTHLALPPEEQAKYEKAISAQSDNNNDQHIHLTQFELHGLKAIVMYLHSLPTSKKAVPDLILNPINLIRDVRTVVEKHRYDSPESAITNKPILDWWQREPIKFTMKRHVPADGFGLFKKRRQSGDEHKQAKMYPPNAAKSRHRRVRCKTCEACVREDCRTCTFCRDMSKYGGPGTMKQTCKLKKCLMPSLPAAACCYLCDHDGWGRLPGTAALSKHPDSPTSLQECSICFKIAHPLCFEPQYGDVEGIKTEDLPNSWECPECVKLEYNKEFKHNRVASSRVSSVGSDTSAKSPGVLSESEEIKIKTEPVDLDVKPDPKLLSTHTIKQEKILDGEPSPPPGMPSWDQLQARVKYPLTRPMWVVRPAPSPEVSDDERDGSSSESDASHTSPSKPLSHSLVKKALVLVFKYLKMNELLIAMRVCRSWAKCSIHPSLWKNIALPPHSRVEELQLMGVVRRQPHSLNLDWCKITEEELSWVIAHLPQVRGLSLHGLTWREIHPLTSPYCPCLTSLDISYCAGIDDRTVIALLSPPSKHRPGHRDDRTRLRHLTRFSLAGTQIGSLGVQAIASSLPFLTHLDLSSCVRITEDAPAVLALSTSLVCHSLTSLDMRGCNQMSPLCLPSLAELPRLSRLALHPCSNIPLPALKAWGSTHNYTFDGDFVMNRTPPEPIDMAAGLVSDGEAPSGGTAYINGSKLNGKAGQLSDKDLSPVCNGEKTKKILNGISPTTGKASSLIKDQRPENEAKEGKESVSHSVSDKNTPPDKSTKSDKDKATHKLSDSKFKKSGVKVRISKSLGDPLTKKGKESDKTPRTKSLDGATGKKKKHPRVPRIENQQEKSHTHPQGPDAKKKSLHKMKSMKKEKGAIIEDHERFKSKKSILKNPKSKIHSKKQRLHSPGPSKARPKTKSGEYPTTPTKTTHERKGSLKITVPKRPSASTSPDSSENARRRSERSNKGTKYKHGLASKRKISNTLKDKGGREPLKDQVKDKLLKADLKVEISKEDQIIHEEVCEVSPQHSNPDLAVIEDEDPLKITPEDLSARESMQKAISKEVETRIEAIQTEPVKKKVKNIKKCRKVRVKDIMTRSKRQKRDENEPKETLPSSDKKSKKSDDESKAPKISKRERNASEEKETREDSPKIRKIQLESASIAKLRTKSADDSSPSSSEERTKLKRKSLSQDGSDPVPVTERKSRLDKTQEEKNRNPSTKIQRKKADETETGTKKKDKIEESVKKSKDNVCTGPTGSSCMTKRKERNGSSSSSSPSSPASKPGTAESTRRRSDATLPSSTSTPSSTTPACSNSPNPSVPPVSTGNSTGSVSSGRDRPERQHRSPRRLSMCQ